MNEELRKAKITKECDGVKYIVHDPEGEMEKTFPNLTFLGNEVFKRLKIHCSVTFVMDVEIVLTGITELVDGFDNPAKEISDAEIETNMKEEYWKLGKLVRDWFEGKLDPGFYYNEWNNEVFIDKLLELKN